jgi:hypothetical protein
MCSILFSKAIDFCYLLRNFQGFLFFDENRGDPTKIPNKICDNFSTLPSQSQEKYVIQNPSTTGMGLKAQSK